MNDRVEPCWVETYRNKEYAPARNLIMAIRIAVIFLEDRTEDRREISPIRLMEGGAAIFAADSKKNIMDIDGNREINPFEMYNLRLCVDS